MNKRKIVFLTPDCFLDVDIPVVKTLQEKYDIHWFVIIDKRQPRNMYSPGWIQEFCLNNQIKLHLFSRFDPYFSFKIVRFYRSIIDEILLLQPGLIYTSFIGTPLFLIQLYSRFSEKKVIIALHDVKHHIGERYRYVKDMYLYLIGILYTNFHFFSKLQRALFLGRVFIKLKHAFYMPLCLKDFGPAPEVTENFSEKIQFLFFGQIRENKGLDVLLEAVALMGDLNNHFEILISGYTKDWNDNYKKLVTTNNVKCDIRMIPNEEVPELFSKVHYLILPYKDVTQSGPLFISYNYQTPIIASRLQGFQEFIKDKVTGYLFDSENSKDLANVLSDIINNHSVEYRGMVVRLGTYIDEELSREHICKLYDDNFKKILQ